MDLVGLIVERAISEAMARGEWDTSSLAGSPLTDLDEQRQPGWWAAQLVARERSRALREDLDDELALSRARLWRAADIDDLRAAVTEANRRIASANGRLEPADRLPLVDWHEAVETWRRARPAG